MTDLFPIVQPEAVSAETAALPLCREVAWDFAAGTPRYSAGSPVEVSGAEAVIVDVSILQALSSAA